MRVLNCASPCDYLILLKMKNTQIAIEFYQQFNGKEFNSIEQDKCQLRFVQQISISDIDQNLENSQFSSPEILFKSWINLTPQKFKEEKCPICLDAFEKILEQKQLGFQPIQPPILFQHISLDIQYTLFVLCGHRFHWKCLLEWHEQTCPVCRYHISPPEEVKCDLCNNSVNNSELWLCLLCGNVGCQEHAILHYNESQHVYSKNLNSQLIWDYASQQNLHRVIINNVDGKLIGMQEDIQDIQQQQQQVQSGDISKLDQRTLFNKKLEAITLEYNQLLTTQLEASREHYVQMLQNKEATLNQRIIKMNKQINKKKNRQERINKQEEIQKQLEEEKQQLLQKIEMEEKINLMFQEKLREKQQSTSKKVYEWNQEAENEINELKQQIKELEFHQKMENNQEMFQNSSIVLVQGNKKKQKSKKR